MSISPPSLYPPYCPPDPMPGRIPPILHPSSEGRIPIGENRYGNPIGSIISLVSTILGAPPSAPNFDVSSCVASAGTIAVPSPLGGSIGTPITMPPIVPVPPPMMKPPRDVPEGLEPHPHIDHDKPGHKICVIL